MDVGAFLEQLREEGAGEIVHIETLPQRTPTLHDLPPDVPELLVTRLGLLGITGLFPHQSEGLDAALRRQHVVVATGTASGKTLVYELAYAMTVLDDPRATALLLYPTKALARDQLRQLRALKLPQIRAAVYDGDTPREERQLIRKNANVILTNPDMLHASLLPDHARWGDFFLRLRIAVLDEAHTARGVFGSHVSMILRRLRRICAHYGGDPTWIMASATIGNPSELAERLTGLSFDEVTVDGSPSGEKTFALWNPPVVDDVTGARRSSLTDAAHLVATLVEDDVRTIAFARSRRGAEVLAEHARRELPAVMKDLVKAYRAGYLAEDRRELERALAEGELRAICSTSALELGIDVGSLDAAVLSGYPGTRASMWQQAGRAGRTSGSSLAILVAQDDPLDQYLVAHPDDLFSQPAEAAVIDPTNPYILEPHLLCAAREQPMRHDELAFFGAASEAVVLQLQERGALTERGGLLYHRGRQAPHRGIDIRSAGSSLVQIVLADTGELLGTIDAARAHSQVHQGAIYLHQGERFLVEELRLDHPAALVTTADDVDYYTQARASTDIRIQAVHAEHTTADVTTTFGETLVTHRVTGFVRRHHGTGRALGSEDLDLPEQTLLTKAIWWQLPTMLLGRAALTPGQVAGAVHAAEHAAIGLLPLIATCDRWDVGGVSTPMHPDTQTATIFIYDGYPGGAGIVERGALDAQRWLQATRDTIANCPCSAGCPSCIVSPKCGNGNEPLDKQGALSLTSAMLGVPWG